MLIVVMLSVIMLIVIAPNFPQCSLKRNKILMEDCSMLSPSPVPPIISLKGVANMEKLTNILASYDFDEVII
jgi:hypothetical protein